MKFRKSPQENARLAIYATKHEEDGMHLYAEVRVMSEGLVENPLDLIGIGTIASGAALRGTTARNNHHLGFARGPLDDLERLALAKEGGACR